MPSSLSELAATLDELEPTAAMAEAAQKALLQKETQALQEILRRVWLLMTMQDAKTRESCYRHEITLLEISEKAYTGENSGLRVCSRLVFCIDQRLFLRFEVEQWGDCAFQIQDEQELSCEMAVKSYGLDAICRGLQGELRSGLSGESDSDGLPGAAFGGGKGPGGAGVSGGADAAKGGTLGILVSPVHFFGLYGSRGCPNADPLPWRASPLPSASSFCRASIPSAEGCRRDIPE